MSTNIPGLPRPARALVAKPFESTLAAQGVEYRGVQDRTFSHERFRFSRHDKITPTERVGQIM